jgi:hypothetical protein
VLTIATFKWTPQPGYRSTFAPSAVNVLKRMIDRHYAPPHRVVCITDDPAGLDPGIDVLPLWNDYAHVPSPQGGKNPSCYRRLRVFAPEMAEILGPRFVVLDLDVVIVADVAPLWDRPEDFVIWGDTHPTTAYNGSMLLMTAGARRQVWDRFDPIASPKAATAAGCWGSDQGWISYCLGPGERRWSRADGVYSFRNDLRGSNGHRALLPENARMVMFHGNVDPWAGGQDIPWVRRHWV